MTYLTADEKDTFLARIRLALAWHRDASDPKYEHAESLRRHAQEFLRASELNADASGSATLGM